MRNLLTIGILILTINLTEERRINTPKSKQRDLYELKTIPNYPGLYFVPQYWFILSSTTWELLYNVPLDPLTRRIKLLDELWKELQNHKLNHTFIQWGNPKIELLENAIIETHETYSQLSSLLVHHDPDIRRKRAIFDSLGKALKIVTGTMDSDDQQYYDEKINTIALDNRHIYQLEKDQLTIIQSTLWGVNKTTLEMKRNQDLLTEAYKYLEKLSISNREVIENVTLRYNKHAELIQELSVIYQLVTETQNYLEVIYNAIDAARQGRISSYLIKPSEMANILHNVQSSLHVGDSLPIPVTVSNIYKYYDIVKITVYLVDNNLRYIIKIPLQHLSRRFHLFKIIPLPQLVQKLIKKDEILGHMYSYPEVSTKYLGISEDLSYYVTPDQTQVNQCTKPPLIICDSMPIIFPMDESHKSHARCEIDIFRNKTEPNCKFVASNIVNPQWEHIPYSNTWVFSAVPDNEIVTITCKNNEGVMAYVSDIRLPSSGMLTLAADCTAVGSSFTLLSRDSERTELSMHNEYDLIIPKINISLSQAEADIIKEFKNFTSKAKEMSLHHITHNLNDLNVASIRITKLKEMMDQYEPERFETHIESTNSYAIVLIMTIIVIYVAVKCGIFKLIKSCLKPKKKNNVVYALRELNSEVVSDELVEEELPISVESNVNARISNNVPVRKSLRLLK